MRAWAPPTDHTPVREGRRAVLLIDPDAFTRNCFAEILRHELPDLTIRAFPTVADLDPAEAGWIVLAAVNIDDRIAADTSVQMELSRLRAAAPQAPIALLSRRQDDGAVRLGMRGQIGGFIPTTLGLDIIVAALRLVLAGGSYDPRHAMPDTAAGSSRPEAVQVVPDASTITLPHAADASRNPCASGSAWRLTPREAQVLEALKRGQANKAIAYELNLSENTVKVHIQRIMRKLQVSNRTEAVVMAQQHAALKAG
jgi:DNA-binding NarL/FixJ family response regulator